MADIRTLDEAIAHWRCAERDAALLRERFARDARLKVVKRGDRYAVVRDGVTGDLHAPCRMIMRDGEVVGLLMNDEIRRTFVEVELSSVNDSVKEWMIFE